MSEYVCEGDKVEGAKCSIYTRKEEWKNLQRDPITNKPMVKYELSKNCSVEITEKLELTEEEKNLRKQKKQLHSEVGDKLKALCITIYVDQKKKLPEPDVTASTGRHEGRLFYTDKRTIGVIKHPFENLTNATQARLVAANTQKELKKK